MTLASAFAINRITNRWRIIAANWTTVAKFASLTGEVVVIRHAAITLGTRDSWFTLAAACGVALQTRGAFPVAHAVVAFVVVLASVEAHDAVFAILAFGVALTVGAVAAVACTLIQIGTEFASV